MAKTSVRRDGALAELVLAGPPLNLFDEAMVADVEAAIAGLRGSDARAVLLRAEGTVFCAGVDVHEFQGLSAAQGSALMARMLGLTRALEALEVPTLAVVHGLNLTIGFELTPGAGGTQRLVARAGVARAAELVLTGDLYGAAELREWGVVNRVLPAAELLPAARAYAAALAGGPTVALAAAKTILRTARDAGTVAADAITPAAVGALFDTADLPAGVASLLTDGPGRATFEGR